MTKYHAVRVTLDGITFDSKREAARWAELRLLEQAGEISLLKVHPKYCIHEGFYSNEKWIQPIYYIADFEYVEGTIWVTEDVKGVETAVFRLKAKLFKSAFPGYELRIVR